MQLIKSLQQFDYLLDKQWWLADKKRLKVLATGLFILLLSLSLLSGDDDEASQVYQVAKKSFDVEVLARGELKPAKVLPIKSLISARNSKLLWLAEDGKKVKKGEVIARFDQSQYQEELIQAEQKVADAKANFELAQQALEIYQVEKVKKLDKAVKEREVARLKAKDMLEGSGLLLQERLQLDLAQAERSYIIAKEELADYDLLLKKGHVSAREREKAADVARQLSEQKSLKIKELANFSKYEWPRLKREAEIAKENAESNYQRTVRILELDLQKTQGSVTKAARDLLRTEKKFKIVQQNIKNCAVIAPIAGQIFHTSLPRPEGKRKIQVGDNIWAGQTFMHIPDTQKLIFEANIREFDLARVDIGQEAEIHLDAFAQQTIKAKIKRVNTLAQDKSNSSINRFSIILDINQELKNARTGMYGQAKVMIAQVQEKLAIPINYLHKDNTGHWVWLDDGGKQKQEISIGQTNHSWVEVEHGLSQGDLLLSNLNHD